MSDPVTYALFLVGLVLVIIAGHVATCRDPDPALAAVPLTLGVTLLACVYHYSPLVAAWRML